MFNVIIIKQTADRTSIKVEQVWYNILLIIIIAHCDYSIHT